MNTVSQAGVVKSVTGVRSLALNSFVLLVVGSLGEADGGLTVTVADEGLTSVVFGWRGRRKKGAALSP